MWLSVATLARQSLALLDQLVGIHGYGSIVRSQDGVGQIRLTVCQPFTNFALIFREIPSNHWQIKGSEDASIRFSLQQEAKALLN